MKYSAVFFDWGDTLSVLDDRHVPQYSEWCSKMIKQLYHSCYRLAIISNTHRYQDAHWIRNELSRRNLLQYFELVMSSATLGIHKPSLGIFCRVLDYMNILPAKVLMVGDSEHCDGAGQYLGMGYLKVKPKDNWYKDLLKELDDPMPANRKLSNLFDYHRFEGNKIITKVRHLSEPLSVGDHVMVGNVECKVTGMNRVVTKEDILKPHNDDFVQIEITEDLVGCLI